MAGILLETDIDGTKTFFDYDEDLKKAVTWKQWDAEPYLKEAKEMRDMYALRGINKESPLRCKFKLPPELLENWELQYKDRLGGKSLLSKENKALFNRLIDNPDYKMLRTDW